MDDPANPFAHVMLAKRALSLPRAVVGITKSGEYAVSSYVFDKTCWNDQKIKEWLGLEKHDAAAYSFETSGTDISVVINPPTSYEKLRVIRVSQELCKALLGGMSIDTLRDKLQDALTSKWPPSASGVVGPSGHFPYIVEFYEDCVVIAQGSELWKVDYKLHGMDVILGERRSVERIYQEKEKAMEKTLPQDCARAASKLNVTHRLHMLLDKFNPCHNASDGQFCSTSGGGGGADGKAPTTTASGKKIENPGDRNNQGVKRWDDTLSMLEANPELGKKDPKELVPDFFNGTVFGVDRAKFDEANTLFFERSRANAERAVQRAGLASYKDLAKPLQAQAKKEPKTEAGKYAYETARQMYRYARGLGLGLPGTN